MVQRIAGHYPMHNQLLYFIPLPFLLFSSLLSSHSVFRSIILLAFLKVLHKMQLQTPAINDSFFLSSFLLIPNNSWCGQTMYSCHLTPLFIPWLHLHKHLLCPVKVSAAWWGGGVWWGQTNLYADFSDFLCPSSTLFFPLLMELPWGASGKDVSSLNGPLLPTSCCESDSHQLNHGEWAWERYVFRHRDLNNQEHKSTRQVHIHRVWGCAWMALGALSLL